MLRLVVGPYLNAHKRHVRDPLYSFNSLLDIFMGLAARRRRPSARNRLLADPEIG